MRTRAFAVSLPVGLFAGLLAGCGNPVEATTTFGDSAGGDAPTTSAADHSSSDTGEGDTGDPFIFDVGEEGTGGTEGASGCQKVDFLFVIDNSGSMGDEQDQLLSSFPGFMSTIQSTLMAQDYHVMVVDTDEKTDGLQVWQTCSPDPECCEPLCEHNPLTHCNGVQCVEQTGCDAEWGAGVIYPLGPGATNEVCEFAGGNRYILDGEPNLEAAFVCAADLGTAGAVAHPMQAMTRAVSDDLNDAGGCNEGFLRDDAILVVTFITDTEEWTTLSPGDPADWRQSLLAAKNGDPDAIVVLGLLGDPDVQGGVCTDPEAAEAVRLRQFVDLFDDRGSWASVCEPDYSPFFAEAVSVIDATCDEFEPPG